MKPYDLPAFIDDVKVVVGSTNDEYEITGRISELMSDLLASGYRLPSEFIRPSSDRHVNYPLYIAPDQSWSIASVVWKVGQRTPVHGHETWGVVGVYSGAERELRYDKPTAGEPVRPLKSVGEYVWERGQVTVCCTTDDDVHAVEAVGEEPTIGIHVYGANLGTLSRPMFDPATGVVRWFVSGWDTPVADDGERQAS